ncbi:MAG: hypothetical protein HZC42_06335 [Candidatus Eisenbacteria bacterium]|nr:hypothetical protein [Candidatus Eisenbacteria bacterium]
MPSDLHARRPISTRHAFALAFDLALRRDPLHSVVVPLLVRAPWILALVVLSSPGDSEPSSTTILLWSGAALGAAVSWWAVDAMLRFRARSVFNAPATAAPAPVLECYELGLRRLPWLYLTECVRNVAVSFASTFLILPGIFLSYRLAFSTEAVVLTEPHLAGAFRRSFRLSRRRFERWLEMIVVSVLLVLATWFVGAVLSLAIGRVSLRAWGVVGLMLAASLWPVLQYAWTFFYLRLAEVEEQEAEEAEPADDERIPPAPSWPPAGGPPALTLVEPPRTEREGDGRA